MLKAKAGALIACTVVKPRSHTARLPCLPYSTCKTGRGTPERSTRRTHPPALHTPGRSAHHMIHIHKHNPHTTVEPRPEENPFR